MSKKIGKTNVFLLESEEFLQIFDEKNQETDEKKIKSVSKITIFWLDEQRAKMLETRKGKSNGGKNGRNKQLGIPQSKPRHIDKEVDKEVDKEKENSKVNFSEKVHNCFSFCLKFFPDNTHPKTEAQKNKWLETLDKMERIDGVTLKECAKIIEFTRKHDFWSTKFLSLTKLRTKNRDGVMYHIVFSALMNPEKQKMHPDRFDQKYLRTLSPKQTDSYYKHLRSLGWVYNSAKGVWSKKQNA